MKVQRQLFAAALLLSVIVPATAGVPATDRREHLRLLRTQISKQMNLSPLDRAYLDGLTILGQPNTCREFFGGGSAQTVLTELVIRLRETRLNDSSVGVRMSGRFTMFTEEHLSFRLFEDAELNTAGPFLRARVSPAEPFVPRVGSFQPNTRAVRALILLHELAHLIQARDGAWLIPDDGNRPDLSSANTRTIEARCGEQIRLL